MLVSETLSLNFDESTDEELVFDYTREHANLRQTGAQIRIHTPLLGAIPPHKMKAFFEFEVSAFREALQQFEKENKVDCD